MKEASKYVVAALCGLMILVACTAGCTSSNTSPSPSTQAAGVESISVSENASVTQSAKHAAVNVSVRYVGSPQSIGPLKATPSDGYTFVVYNATVKDVNESNYLVTTSNFFLTLSDGNLTLPWYLVNYTEALGGTGGILTLQPGQTASGTLVYQVPNGVSPETIVYRQAMLYYEDVRTFDASTS
jgi:Domain of unknown function (DUF4352)